MNIKSVFVQVLFGLLAAGTLPPAGAQTNSYPAQLAVFAVAKEHQAQRIASDGHVALPPEAREFFAAAQHEDYPAMSNIVARCGAQLYAGAASPANPHPPAWLPFFQVMNEVESGYSYFAQHPPGYLRVFADGIIQSIPAGSIYFGGTDQGRLLVTALCESQTEGRPFYTLTQNALSDGSYMDYLRAMYGKAIHLPSTNDVQKAVDDYKADVLRRNETGRLQPGELVRNGEVQLNGQVPVMAIHELLVKWILDQNPKPEFYYEESFPLRSLYANLSPHGLIFEMHHEALARLPAADMDADHAYWTKLCGKMLGDWLKPDTTVSNLCEEALAIYQEKDKSRFTGDREFLTDDFASKAFSKLRVSIAGLYEWRWTNDKGSRFKAEADYAFRQAYALCPTSPEATFRYVNFLMAQGRFDDAILIVQTTLNLMPADNHFHHQYESMLMQLKQYRKQVGGAGK